MITHIFLSQILTLISLNLLAFIRFIFTHNETDSFYNYRCSVLLQSISAEGDFGSTRWLWGRRTRVISSQWFKLPKFFFSYLIFLKGNEKAHLFTETRPQSLLMLTPCTHKRADKESLVSLMESQVQSLHPFLLKSALHFKVVLLY